MQFILNNQIGRQKARHRELDPGSWIAGSIESVLVAALHPSKESANMARPGKSRELVHGRNQEARQSAVDRFVHGKDRQRYATAKLAISIDAGDAQIVRIVVRRNQPKRQLAKFGSTPRALFQRNRGWLSVIILKPVGPG